MYVKSQNILFKFLGYLNLEKLNHYLLHVCYHQSEYSYNHRRKNCNADLTKNIYISDLCIFQDCRSSNSCIFHARKHI